MRTLLQAELARTTTGQPLPHVWEALRKRHALFHRSTVSLIVGSPGAGKTAFALAYAVQAKQPTLYISADTDDMTLRNMVASMVTCLPAESLDVERRQQALAATDHMSFATMHSPTVPEIFDEVKAYMEIEGQPPALLVVDNLKDIVAGEENGWAAARLIIEQLKGFAGDMEMAVIILAHATGQYENGDQVIPLGGLENKSGKDAAMVLTLRRVNHEFEVHVVKNRRGPADATGALSALLFCDLSVFEFRDWEPYDGLRN